MKPVVHADQPLEPWRAGVETRMLVSARTGAAQLCIFEQWIALGAALRPIAIRSKKCSRWPRGQAEMWIDDEHFALAPGQSLIVPAGRKREFRNTGSDTLHVRAVLASSIFEASFDGADEPVRRWLAAPSRPGLITVASRSLIRARVGKVFRPRRTSIAAIGESAAPVM